MDRHARWIPVVLTIALAPFAVAQGRHRTTIGQLLGERVDTIALHQSVAGELGRRAADLLLTRSDSGFVGVLRLNTTRHDDVADVKECDTTMTSYIPRARAERMLALIASTMIDSGAAPYRRLMVTDIWWDQWVRLSGRRDSAVIRDWRTIEHGGMEYHPVAVPVPRGQQPKADRLEQGYRILDPYVRWKHLAIVDRCRQR